MYRNNNLFIIINADLFDDIDIDIPDKYLRFIYEDSWDNKIRQFPKIVFTLTENELTSYSINKIEFCCGDDDSTSLCQVWYNRCEAFQLNKNGHDLFNLYSMTYDNYSYDDFCEDGTENEIIKKYTGLDIE